MVKLFLGDLENVFEIPELQNFRKYPNCTQVLIATKTNILAFGTIDLPLLNVMGTMNIMAYFSCVVDRRPAYLTPESCDFLIEHLGFVPIFKFSKDQIVLDVEATFSNEDAMYKRKKPVTMGSIMNVRVPQAFINSMNLVQGLAGFRMTFDGELTLDTDAVGSVEFKISEGFFPKELQELVIPALNELKCGKKVSNIKFIAVYEILDMPIYPKMLIHGDQLLEDNFRNRALSGRLFEKKDESFCMSIELGSLKNHPTDYSWITPKIIRDLGLDSKHVISLQAKYQNL